jgi:hypothetical protein
MDDLSRALADSPAFDATTVDALPHHQVSVGVMITDDDPDPNDVRRLLISCPLGIWETALSEDGAWAIAGVPVGPDLARSCEFARSYHYAAQDLAQHQGPGARLGYDLPGYPA